MKPAWRGLRGYEALLLAVCLAVVVNTSVFDLALLERKYNAFSGGFLQAHQITGLSTVAGFVGTLLVIEALFFVALAGLWGAVGLRLGARAAMVAYHFLFVVGGVSVAIIAFRYQLLSYFSDFMSFAVLQNLGGGDLTEAIVFGLEEGRLFALLLTAGLLLYVTGDVILRRTLRQLPSPRMLDGTARTYLGSSLAAITLLAVTILTVNRSEPFRHHLSRLTAYH